MCLNYIGHILSLRGILDSISLSEIKSYINVKIVSLHTCKISHFSKISSHWLRFIFISSLFSLSSSGILIQNTYKTFQLKNWPRQSEKYFPVLRILRIKNNRFRGIIYQYSLQSISCCVFFLSKECRSWLCKSNSVCIIEIY
ncbi:unnamed protein product [Acanthoscelides obtectus]|uniref:Uncharacterized protein n=1 Tax=Acanthoscelides obtectus TaxID=200917 RepID=A0A9P0JJ05_ACAOB|nr:unnamed protein product [Acanthoscelides obtectus]CAK1628866.1 hypothetical protein AOBTE_LOCUS5440 [Acanthoscelides obtectus]